MGILALAFAVGSLWALFGAASVIFWLFFAALSLVCAIISFVIRKTFRLLAVVGILIVCISCLIEFM